MVFGLHAVQALLNSTPARVQMLYVAKGREDHKLKKILQMADRHNIAVKSVARKQLDEWAQDGNHQGIIASCEPGKVHDESYLYELLKETTNALVLVLDGVTDPHNLGACLRSADAAGVTCVVAPKDKSVGITPVVSKVACGAAENVPFITVTNLARALGRLQELGLWIVGAAGEAEQSYCEVDLKGPSVIVMGAEGSGLRRLTKESCDYLVNIPMKGSVSSLNVSVATGILLFEAVRQRAG